jgi:hypothetical protein
MDRRDALKAFLALPASATITRHKIKPGHIAIIECEEDPSYEEAVLLRDSWNKLLPDIPCVVTGRGVRIRFAEPEEE